MKPFNAGSPRLGSVEGDMTALSEALDTPGSVASKVKFAAAVQVEGGEGGEGGAASPAAEVAPVEGVATEGTVVAEAAAADVAAPPPAEAEVAAAETVVS